MKRQVGLVFLGMLLVGAGMSRLAGSVQPRTFVEPPKKLVAIPQTSTQAAVLGETQQKQETVSRVIDGDTIELTNGKKVRYIGIDTPEVVDPRKPVECFGREAANQNRTLVEGKTVWLEKDISDIDRWGRLLRYVYVGDVFVNDTLVREGFAKASTYPPDVRFRERFRNAQQEARDQRKGLWAGCPDGSAR